MNKELAARVTYFLRNSSVSIVHTIRLVKCYGTEEEFDKYSRDACSVLAAMGEEISWYIDDEYPDLDPNSTSYLGDSAIHEGRLFAEKYEDEPSRGYPEAQDPVSAGAAPPPESPHRKGTRMDKDIAARIAYISRSCAGLLRHTVWLVKQQGTEEEFVNYKMAMGRVLAEMQTRLLDPIYAEYPDLDHKSPSFSGPPEYQHEEKYLPEDEDYPAEANPEDRKA